MTVRESASGFLAAAAGLFGLLFLSLQIGIFAPVVREHCMAENDLTSGINVDSGWKLTWPGYGARDTIEGNGICVRNTLTREALGWIGIWPLEEPRQQVEEATVGAVQTSDGGDAARWVERVLDLRAASAEASAEISRLVSSGTPADFRQAVVLAVEDQEMIVDGLRNADPPAGAATELNRILLDANHELLVAAEKLLVVLDTGSPAEIRDAMAAFDATSARVVQELETAWGEAQALAPE